MTTKVVPGQLVATREPSEVSTEAATRIGRALREAIKTNGSATLALSGGGTPEPAYRLLAADKSIDWGKVDVFFIDDRAVPPDHDRSNYKLAKRSLLDPAGVPPANVHRMMGEAEDLAAAARDYEKVIRAKVRLGPDGVHAFDVEVLGVGEDGHIASLFPGDAAVDVADALVVSVPAKGEREARITVTTPMIEHGRALFILAIGKSKCDALERIWSVHGKVQDTPARIIRGARGSVTWVIDRAAGGVFT